MSGKNDNLSPNGAPTETQPSDVSRETVDLIEIMGRPAPQAPDPPEDKPGTEPPPQKEAAPSPPGKNKPSSFYVYLAVLFGAAFLMLLLAYFVQRRNNETVQDNLRTTTASREELLEEVETLKQEKQALLNEMGDLQRQLEQLQADLNFANTSLDDLGSEYFKYVDFTSILQALYTAEVKLESGDYEGAARELTGIEYGDFVSTIDLFDAETKQYNPYYPDKGMLLRPRFDALVSVLTEQGALEDSWAEQQS